MKSKKKFLILSIILILIIIISIYIFNSLNKYNKFINLLNKVTNKVTDILDYSSITGDAKIKVNVGSDLRKENIIIDNVDYNVNYQINLKEGDTSIDIEGIYDKETLKSNIYINDSKIYILLEDIFDKNIIYNNKYLNVLDNPSDYRTIINILNKELNNLLKSKHFTKDTVTLNNKKMTKITLDLTKNNYKSLKKDLIDELSQNKEFMKSLSKINNDKYTKKELINKIKNLDMNDCKFSLYFTKNSNEFVRFEVDGKEVDIKLEYKNNKYYVQYYLRNGLVYNGYIKIKNNNISEFYLVDNLKHYFVDLKFEKLNINHNKKIDSSKTITKNNSIDYQKLTENDKTTIRKNNIINTIYNNYQNRYYQEMIPNYDPTVSETLDGPP